VNTEAVPRPLAVVTGASSGIGHELAKQFVENGYDVVAAAEDDDVDFAAADARSTSALSA
jgi:NAD(P)-dependent dehydrogenase (short-subunit alcohol dehydrogenase family)